MTAELRVTKKRHGRISSDFFPFFCHYRRNLKLEEKTTMGSEEGGKHKGLNSHQLDKDVK